MESFFFEISIVIITATFCATVAKLLRQPMIPAYILSGIILGPSVLAVIETGEELKTLSTFGISFLLFLVGIELDVRKFLKTSKVAVTIGIIQMVFAVGVGYLIIIALGFASMEALFLALALGFSSTIVVLKLLEEKKEISSLHAQIIIGLMLTQDFIALLFLIFFGVLSQATGEPIEVLQSFLWTIPKAAGLLLVTLGSAKFLLSRVFRYFARSTELLFLGAISWCLVYALLAHELGFSIEVGSFLAGVSLSFVPYSIDIASRIKSLRDFFLPIFFAILGGQLVFSGSNDILLPTVILSALVLLGSPILVSGILLAWGYRARVSFRVGTAIGQVSEFSFIVVTLGLTAGVIGQDIVSLVALIGLVTMTLSTYMIEYSSQLYKWCAPLVKKFERIQKNIDVLDIHIENHVILFGHHTLGYKVRTLLQKNNTPYIVVDHDPDVIHALTAAHIPNIYGSIEDEEILEKTYIEKARMVISTVPSRSGTIRMLHSVKKQYPDIIVIVIAFHASDAHHYYQQGADYVIHPTLMSAQHIAELLEGRLTEKKEQHLKDLEEIIEIQKESKK